MICGAKSQTCQRCLALHSVKMAVNKAAYHLWLLSIRSENLLLRCRPVIKTLVNLPTQGALEKSFPSGQSAPAGMSLTLLCVCPLG